MMTTVKTAGIATVFALLLAYPLAYALTISGGKVRALILVFVLIPYWVDIIVRSFSWLILLGDNGMVNKALMGLGIIATPLQLLYNPFSVLLAMVQILLPLTTVTLFGAMLRIDRTLITAAKIHGASGWHAFRTVFFPLSLPGVMARLKFSPRLYCVTPAPLGSPRETMIAQTIMVKRFRLDWPHERSAVLLISPRRSRPYNRTSAPTGCGGQNERDAGKLRMSVAWPF